MVRKKYASKIEIATGLIKKQEEPNGQMKLDI